MTLKRRKENLREQIEEGKRMGERELEEYREIEITPDYINESAEGSALIKIGETKVLVGVKMDTGEPYPDRPEQGSLITNAELVPMASPDYESGPPGEEATEIARVVDRGIRESGMVKLTDLCIEEGEKVWKVFVDIHVLDYDGNLIDAAFLGAVTALIGSKVPEYDQEEDLINREETQGDLKVEEVPMTATASKINGKLIFDTDADEEEVLDSRVTFTFKENGNICSIQKGEELPLEKEEVAEMAEKAYEKSEMLREKVEKAL